MQLCWGTAREAAAAEAYAAEYKERLFRTFPDDAVVLERAALGRTLLPFEDLLEGPIEIGKLARYVAWLQDISPDAAGVITVPAWLPAESPEAQSRSLIACIRRGARVSGHDILGLVSAFRMGNADIVEQTVRRESIAMKEEVVGHEAVGQLTTARQLVQFLASRHMDGSVDARAIEHMAVGSIDYARLFMIPRASRLDDWVPRQERECASTWLERSADLAWRIAVARAASGATTAPAIQAYMRLIPERPTVQVSCDPPDAVFNPPEEVAAADGSYPHLAYDLARWVLAALSNAFKWSAPAGQQPGRDRAEVPGAIGTIVQEFEPWRDAGAFRSIHIILRASEDACELAIYNGTSSHPAATDLRQGTGRVLEAMRERLPRASMYFDRVDDTSAEAVLPNEAHRFLAKLTVLERLFASASGLGANGGTR